MKYIANPVEVEAYRIASVGEPYGGGELAMRDCACDDGVTRVATVAMMSRYTPVEGDYWVVQSDGYFYLNPREVFERKYHASIEPKINLNGIGWAIKNMHNGSRVRRAGWNGKGMFIAYQPGYPDGVPINANTSRAMGLPEGTFVKFDPYIMMRTVTGSCVPWLASQTELLATDWEIAE